MAENQTKRQIEFVQLSVDIATRLDNLLNECAAHAAQYNFIGDLSTAPIWDNGDIQHTSAADIATLVTRVTELNAWFAETGQFRRDILREVRR